jgi:hypothetical protein
MAKTKENMVEARVLGSYVSASMSFILPRIIPRDAVLQFTDPDDRPFRVDYSDLVFLKFGGAEVLEANAWWRITRLNWAPNGPDNLLIELDFVKTQGGS